jgi:hypothetical protein
LRKRSKSLGDFENNVVMYNNIKEKWGKGMWECSNYGSDKGLVGPLKIIKLPPRSPAKSRMYSLFQSIRGSIEPSPRQLEAQEQATITFNTAGIDMEKNLDKARAQVLMDHRSSTPCMPVYVDAKIVFNMNNVQI